MSESGKLVLSVLGIFGVGCCVLNAAPVASPPAVSAAQATVVKGASVGQEQKDMGRRLKTATPKKTKPAPKVPKLKVPPSPPAPPSGPAPEGTKWLYEVRFTAPASCTDFLDSLNRNRAGLKKKGGRSKVSRQAVAADSETLSNLLSDGSGRVTDTALIVRDIRPNGRHVTKASVMEAVTNVLGLVVADGFYIATLMEEPTDLTNGVLGVKFDPGRIGRVNVAFKNPAPAKPVKKPKAKAAVKGKAGETGKAAEPAKPVAPQTASLDGRYFSHRQIVKRFSQLKSGGSFDYDIFYDGIYQANAHPDLTVNADLRVRPEVDEQRLRWRYVDVDLEVEESLPFHGVIDLSNYGTKASDYWETGLTLQYLNLTRHDDILTLSGKMAIDQSLYSVAGSYYLPYSYWKGGGLTLYGGYADLDVDNVVSDIDVEGTGWFVGLQYTANIIDNDRHHFALAIGKVHRYIEDRLIVEKVDTEKRSVDVAPFSLSAIYSSKPTPNWGGRIYGTLELLYNKGDFMGTSDVDEIQRMRQTASEDYFIVRPQLALIQTLGGRGVGSRGGEGRWVLFMRAAGQWADGALIPGEQLSLGGNNTVRGYLEREYLGDHGVYANIELRTPLYLGFLSRPFASESHIKENMSNPLDRLQLVAFCDAGTIKIEDALPGEDKSQTLASVGLGFRLAVTEHAQLKFDWGFPLKKTDESSHSGTGHLNLQVQF